jgi:hypothetical protein
MVGTVHTTVERDGPYNVVRFNWTSNSTGDAEDWVPINGVVDRVQTQPGVSAAPSANYDVAVNDRRGNDVLQGLLANRSATSEETVRPYMDSADSSHHIEAYIPHGSRLVISNAGDTKSGILLLHMLAI